MAGKLPSAPGELPTLNDWENHLTTIFPEVHTFIWLHGRILLIAYSLRLQMFVVL
jgi:glutamate--cysteine ligase